ncbi:uncharacterized protein LOC125206171 [Salvia hispanica]|uniref:uncharacterized protein LOC125206171 n=1 Tax=Salvia hispanica TaxID=49212 RepID=UPI002009A169|nr:uncharacterized protein LOC125206171 [Salvia hispanica]
MSYTCSVICNDESVMFMFNNAQNSSGCIELFVEYSPVRSSEIPRVVDFGSGSSARVELLSSECGIGSSARGEHMNFDHSMNEQRDVVDVVDVGVGLNDEVDVADVLNEPTTLSETEPEPDLCDGDGSSDDGDGSSDDEIIPCKPVVQGEQPLPEYNTRGLKFFRKLPSRPSGVSDDVVDNEHNNLYWDEKEPHRIVLGTKFDSKLHVKTAITMWSLWQEKQFKVVESKLRRWHAVCKFPAGTTATGIGIISTTDAEKARECKWEVSVTQRAHDDMWEVRKWVGRHTCVGHRANRDHANFSSAMIALCIRHHVRQCADFKVFSIIADVQDRFGVSISYKKAWYAKRKAIEFVYGGWEESFRQLPSYMFELQSQNPGTIVEWKHNELLSQRRTNVFNYVFWAFGPAIHAFQKAAPVLTIDGTHLRGRFKGKLLVACGFDANKTCLPIAYAVVDEETNDSWSWFLDHVRTHVVKYEREVCIISDRHKGIFKAMKSVIMTRAPQIHHKFYLVPVGEGHAC